MEVVYYYDKELEKCPVKEYFKKYLRIKKDSEFSARKKEKVLANIDQKINYVKENQGRPTPPISKPLHGYNFFEILNSKDSKTLIRILYFRYLEKIVLLHAFEKPTSYHTNKEKKKVEKQNLIADKYLNNFKSNPDIYEKYN